MTNHPNDTPAEALARKILKPLGIGVGVLVLIGLAGGDNTPTPTPTVTVMAPAPASTPTAAEVPGPSASFGDGVHLVGADIQPGTYKAANPGGGCYWARLKDTSGEFSSIIANDFTNNQTMVTISKSDAAFESTRCGDWVKVS